jgi:HlyD family secretion protein
MHQLRRRLLWSAAALALVALLVFASRPEAAPVDLAKVVRAPLEITLDEEGVTRVRERFMVAAPSAGKLLRVDLEPGDAVRAGDVLASFAPAASAPLDPRSRRSAEARVAVATAGRERAAAEHAGAIAQHDRARAELVRLGALAGAGLVSPDAVEAAQTAVASAQAAVAAAAAALRSASADIAAAQATLIEGEAAAGQRTLELRSPADGVVLRRHRESEAVVGAGEVILEIGDPQQLEVTADYLSTDAVRITPGQKVRITNWGGATALAGTVRRIEPAGFLEISALGVEEQRVWVVVALDSPPEAWANLGDGYRVETQVVLVERSDVLTVPVGALIRDGGLWSVFVAVDGKARLRPVDIGDRAPFAAEVLSGLAEGDEVVLHPTDRVVDGGRVRPR